MYQKLSTYQAANILRADEGANWSRPGALALVEYLESVEDDSGEEMEMDIVAIRCDYSEYPSLQSFAADCLTTEDEFDWNAETDDDQKDDDVREYIRDHGTLLEFDGGIIVSAF